MHTRELQVTSGAELVTDLTGAVADFCRGLGDGLLNVFVPHATAGVAIIETGSGSEQRSGRHDRSAVATRRPICPPARLAGARP